MKFTKKIMTMATCAVMAASSMVGMSASASDSYNENTLEVATTYNDGYVNPNHCGTYYASNGSFIQVSETQVLFYQVSYASYPKLSGVAYSFSIGTTGYAFTATFNSTDWYYLDDNDTLIRPGYDMSVQGTFRNGIITIGGISYSK